MISDTQYFLDLFPRNQQFLIYNSFGKESLVQLFVLITYFQGFDHTTEININRGLKHTNSYY